MEAVEADPRGRDITPEQEARTTCRRRFSWKSELRDHVLPLWESGRAEPPPSASLDTARGPSFLGVPHPGSSRGVLSCLGARLGQKGDWRSAASSGISSSGADGVASPHLDGCISEPRTDVRDADGCPSRIGADAGSHCQRTIHHRSFWPTSRPRRKRRRKQRSPRRRTKRRSQAGVDRLNGASSHREVHQDQGVSARCGAGESLSSGEAAAKGAVRRSLELLPVRR